MKVFQKTNKIFPKNKKKINKKNNDVCLHFEVSIRWYTGQGNSIELKWENESLQ